ncbi:putative linear gramicidin synthetase subunit D [Mycobacterium xenopi 3993]|nr:putative linear gramicidin synthetase subunit D [Mycobacterium xenopi 3993]
MQPTIQHKQRRPGHGQTDRWRPRPGASGALIDAYTVVSVGP